MQSEGSICRSFVFLQSRPLALPHHHLRGRDYDQQEAHVYADKNRGPSALLSRSHHEKVARCSRRSICREKRRNDLKSLHRGTWYHVKGRGVIFAKEAGALRLFERKEKKTFHLEQRGKTVFRIIR